MQVELDIPKREANRRYYDEREDIEIEVINEEEDEVESSYHSKLNKDQTMGKYD